MAVGPQDHEVHVVLDRIRQNAPSGGRVGHSALLHAGLRKRRPVPHHVVQLCQEIRLADLDYVGHLHVSFLDVNDVQRGIKVVGEVHGVATGVLGTLGAIGRKKNAIDVDHGGTGEK